MELGLAGKTAVITGASKGIGQGIATALAAEGVNLHLVARGADALKEAKSVIGQTHAVDISLHALDLSDERGVRSLTEACPEPDILINNAGAIPGGAIDAVDDAAWRTGWDLKVFGYVNLTRSYYARMRDGGEAPPFRVILNVLGAAGERMDVNYIAGSAGNAGLMAFTRAVGCNSLNSGVRILGLNPGAVMTERIERLMRTRAEAEHGDAERWREYLKNLPRGRAAEVTEVADVATFLVSERANWMSGCIVTVDGGHVATGGGFS